MPLRVACLPGDGIGPEVCDAAVRVLAALSVDVVVEEHSFGGHAIHEHGDPLPEETLAACRAADAVLMGAVGLPEFDGAPVRPEQGLIRLRGELDVYANLRPARTDGIDLLIVRELVGGLGVAASASLGDRAPGIFEPVHGTAPDIAGQGIANPTAAFRSVALLLRHAAGEQELADELEQAVDATLLSSPTRDLGGSATTVEFTDSVLDRLAARTPEAR